MRLLSSATTTPLLLFLDFLSFPWYDDIKTKKLGIEKMSETHRIDYHAGMVSALKMLYDDRYDSMETIKELILGEQPPRLDAVV